MSHKFCFNPLNRFWFDRHIDIVLIIKAVDMRIKKETSYSSVSTSALIEEPLVSPASLLIQDIVNSIIEVGRPPYSDTLFVDQGFSFQEPKKKERTFGNSGIIFPKKCYIGMFPAEYQFCSREALRTFLD